jgi:hypothetical protein
LRAKQKKFPPVHAGILLRRDYRTFDFGQKHNRVACSVLRGGRLRALTFHVSRFTFYFFFGKTTSTS